MDGTVIERLSLELLRASGTEEWQGVRLRSLDPDLVRRLGQASAESRSTILRVAVTVPDTRREDHLPDMAGSYQLGDDALEFIPYVPFEPGVAYRAWFDPGAFDRAHRSEALELTFALPKQASAPPEVTAIFPSGDELPENLLRFYVCFSNPMCHGSARDAIALLGPDGETVEDALYRAPVELWDGEMRRLTVLLDPGRLKRGVGPNRELGPPLKPGAEYTLVVGIGMTDRYGRALAAPVRKNFRATSAVREPVAAGQWILGCPNDGTRDPVTLTFLQPLDWALLGHSISVTSEHGCPIAGQVSIENRETQWRFTPAAPWVPGLHVLRVAATLEDMCGNDLAAPFDRPLRTERQPATEQFFTFRIG